MIMKILKRMALLFAVVSVMACSLSCTSDDDDDDDARIACSL